MLFILPVFVTKLAFSSSEVRAVIIAPISTSVLIVVVEMSMAVIEVSTWVRSFSAEFFAVIDAAVKPF